MHNAFLRYFLLALIVVLLPARGWAGQVMSLQQVSVQQSSVSAAAEVGAVDVVDGAYAMPKDCPMHKAVASESQRLCSGCDDCQLCLTVAAPLPVPSQGSGLRSQAIALAATLRFSSADGLGWLKPPIS
jgi:hypothetical protein